jgi:hypothetical protein
MKKIIIAITFLITALQLNAQGMHITKLASAKQLKFATTGKGSNYIIASQKKRMLGMYEVDSTIANFDNHSDKFQTLSSIKDYTTATYRPYTSIGENEYFHELGHPIMEGAGYEDGDIMIIKSLTTNKCYQLFTLSAYENKYSGDTFLFSPPPPPPTPANIKAMAIRYKSYVDKIITHEKSIVIIQHKYMTKWKQFDSNKCTTIDRKSYNNHINAIQELLVSLDTMVANEVDGNLVEDTITDDNMFKALLDARSDYWNTKI